MLDSATVTTLTMMLKSTIRSADTENMSKQTYHIYLRTVHGGQHRVVRMASDQADALAQGAEAAAEQGMSLDRVRRAPFRPSRHPRR